MPAVLIAPPHSQFFDIGANLLDPIFSGVHHGKQRHAADLDAVLRRADQRGVSHVIITASDLADSRAALELARKMNSSGRFSLRLHSTVGVHPTHTSQLDPVNVDAPTSEAAPEPRLSKGAYIAALEEIISDGLADNTVVAIGECGLDFDRLHFASAETQLAHFPLHFDLAEKFQLPLFLHDRNTGGAFAAQLRSNIHRLPRSGVIHSFTGSISDLEEHLAVGLHIGINGCSLKSEDNCSAAARVPLDRLHLETDAPWCEIRKTHASYKHVCTLFPVSAPEKLDAAVAAAAAAGSDGGLCVKGRCEPCYIVQVGEVMAALRGVSVSELAAAAFCNSVRMFVPHLAQSEKG